jgi:tetratricopeptide (TPR) repeat protein
VSRSPESAETDNLNDYLTGWQAVTDLLRQGRSFSGHERHCVFLNCGEPGSQEPSRFANVSAVTGLDLDDDGRALAVVDWDHDGDLDFWIHNRTGPRLRLMLNGTNSPDRTAAQSFVAFKLRGTTCNRDAIGARVRVEVRSAERGVRSEEDASDAAYSVSQATLIQTLHAGDGFLSQSSKWLHFGLGATREIERVTVHWPGGLTESFAGVQAGHRYVLEQGTGRPVPWSRPQPGAGGLQLVASEQEHVSSGDAAEVFLGHRIPMPVLRYTVDGDPTPREVETHGTPLLVNFWASWCVPCVHELTNLQEQAESLRSSGIQVLALSIDGLSQDRRSQPADASALLRRIDFPFDTGFATTELLDKITIVQEMLFSWRRSFNVPISILLDRNGYLAAIYRGPFRVETLLRDVANLDAAPAEVHDLATPLPGRWAAPHADPAPRWVAKFFVHKHLEDAARFFKMSIELQEAARSGAPDAEADHELAQTCFLFASASRDLGRTDDAAAAFRRATELDPDHAEAHYRLGVMMGLAERRSESVASFREALRVKPDWLQPMNNLAWLLAASGDAALRDGAEAVRHAERAAELTGRGNPFILDTLSAAYAEAGRFGDAILAASEALELVTALERQELADRIREHLDLYRQEKPVRDP